jgi:hypothetical protein
MHRPSTGAAYAAVANCWLFVVAIAAVCLGCKSAPTNPFAAPAEQEAQITDPRYDSTAAAEPESNELARLGADVAAAATDLGQEVTSAARDATDRVQSAAANTVAQETDEAKRLAADAVATAQQIAKNAAADAERRAIASLAAMPLEQAGPLLLLTIAEGGPGARRAAAQQLAARWPAAVSFPVDAVAERRAAALAELRKLWVATYGRIDDALAAAEDARDKLEHVEAAVALARLRVERGSEALKRLSQDGQSEIRLRAARAMGEIADPLFLPPLVAMLDDQGEVREAAMASLARIAGGDVAAGDGGAALSNDERARRWKDWFAKRPRFAGNAQTTGDLRR